MASWHTARGSWCEWARCPVHGALAVQDKEGRWLWKCAECLWEAVDAARHFLARGA